MSKHLERDLESIEQELLAMSSLVEEMIDMACVSLMRRRTDIAEEVIRFDKRVDYREVHIEEECLKVLALHQPVATDLRRVTAVLKINGDLERIADLAVNVAERAEKFILYPSFRVPPGLEQMATRTREMVRQALDSFVNLDVASARRVCLQDDVVDDLNAAVIDRLKETVIADNSTVEPAFYLFSATRQFERMADHATNIAEDVIYLVEGEIARHRHDSPLGAS